METASYDRVAARHMASDAWMPSLGHLKRTLQRHKESQRRHQDMSLRELVKDAATYEINTLNDAAELGSSPSPAKTEKNPVAASTTVASSQGPEAPSRPEDSVYSGDDVVEFYARYGQDSPVKFFYCNRANASVSYLPYDLVVVPKEKRAKDSYFTVSATGVMHIKKGTQMQAASIRDVSVAIAAKAEFTPLSDWVHEKIMFRLLKKLKFYRFFFEMGCFTRWHKTVRQIKFRRLRAHVAERMFCGMSTFAGPLMQLHATLHGVDELKFCPATPNHTYQLEDFRDLQRRTREEQTKPQIGEIANAATQMLDQLCVEVEKEAQLYRESIRDDSELLDRTGVELFQGRSSSKRRSMREIRLEKLRRARSYHRALREETMLCRFVRLIDILLIEKVLSRGLESLHALLEQLTTTTGAASTGRLTKGVIQTTVQFGSDGTEFAPDRARVSAVFGAEIFDGIASVIQQTPHILLTRSFRRYFDDKPATLNAMDVYRTAEKFQTVRQRIVATIEEDFAQAAIYAASFDPYRKIHDFSEAWDPEKLSQTQGLGVRDIRRNLHKQKEWRNDLEKMKISQVVGFLAVETKTLRSTLLPTTERVVEDLKRILLDLARRHTAELLLCYQQKIEQLRNRPLSLDEFADYQARGPRFRMHERELLEKKALRKRASDVDDMYDLLAVHHYRIPTGDQVKVDDLKEAIGSFMEELKNGREFLADQKETQIQNLQSAIQSTNDDLMEIYKALQHGAFVNAESDPNVVVGQLEAHRRHLADIKTRVETFKEQQLLFDTPLDDFQSLELTEKAAQAKLEIWNLFQQFSQLTRTPASPHITFRLHTVEDWLTKPLLTAETHAVQLDVAEIQRVLADWMASAAKLGKENKEERIVFKLKDRIENFKRGVSALELLCHPCLQERHWKRLLETLLAQEQGQNLDLSSLTLQDLMDLKIQNKVNDVMDIATAASEEAAIREDLAKMQRPWEELAFKSVVYKGTEVLDGFKEIHAVLSKQRAEIATLRASQWAAHVEEEIAEWDGVLEKMSEMLRVVQLSQSIWESLQPHSANSDAATHESRVNPEELRSADSIWREWMTTALRAATCLEIVRDASLYEQLQKCHHALSRIYSAATQRGESEPNTDG